MSDSSRLLLAIVVGAVLAASIGRRGRRSARRPIRLVATAIGAACLLGPLGTAAWIGANSPKYGWFGAQVAHGPRTTASVALTFDDGPNDSATDAIARLLEARRVRATFFVVGRSVEARPELTRRLVAGGHLLGNHSFRHDATGWLDPRYPELARTQAVIHRVAGVCPAFYRAPHGQHTPLLSRVVHAHAMIMVGWEASAGDWAARSPGVIARRILRKVRAGSIIDLHDGLDGDPTIDRRVLVRALPLILDGLAERGLQPVRLDELLGRPGTLSRC